MSRLLVVFTVVAIALVPGRALATSKPWSKSPDAMFSGQYIASDPAVLRDGNLYRMFYTCWIPQDPHFLAAICEAKSLDGLTWSHMDGGEHQTIVMQGRAGEWDEHLEASFVVKRDGEYLLYYSGYRHEGYPAMGFPAALAVAKSADGVTFERVRDEPILSPTPGGLDNDAVYSPTIIAQGDELLMIYAGHCYTTCDAGYGVSLLGARSSDGIHWQKESEPVMLPIDGLGWTRDGVAEPGLLAGPDGQYYLFFTGLKDEERAIGGARGASPFGPWDVSPDPIVAPSNNGFDDAGVLAPDVHVEGDVARMWFLATDKSGHFAIGYAEAAWPFWTETA